MKITVLFLSLCVFHTLVSPDTKKQAALRVIPNTSQFFQYEEISLSCEQQGNSSEWRVKRNTSRNMNQECFTSWGRENESFCVTDALYPADSGVYWCESESGEHSDTISITVTAGSVILESPALPLMEGDDVTLRCRNRMTSSSSSSNLLTDFYKDGRLIRSSSTGNMTVYSVSTSDEGVYECNISGAGQSPGSRLTIRVSDQSAAPAAPLISTIGLIRHAVVGTPYLLTTIILGLIYRDNRRVHQLVAEDRRHNIIDEVE